MSIAEKVTTTKVNYDSYIALYRLGFNLIAKQKEDTKAAAMQWKGWQTARQKELEFGYQLDFAEGIGGNMAIVTGKMPWERFGLVVIDVDEGLDAIDFLPSTPLVVDGRIGRRHLYYLHPSRTEIKSTQIKGDGYALCIKADGGCITAPGSVHSSGAIYRASNWPWTKELILSAPVFSLAWFPSVDLIRRESNALSSEGHKLWLSDPRLIPAEQREDFFREHLDKAGFCKQGESADNKFFKLTNEALWCYALPVERVETILIEYGSDERHEDQYGGPWPWSEKDVRRKIRDALCKEPRPYFDEILNASYDEQRVAEIVKPAQLPESKLLPVLPTPSTNGHSTNGHVADDFAAMYADSKTAPATTTTVKGKKKRSTQTQLLVHYAEQSAELFRTSDHVAYAVVPNGSHKENVLLRSAKFKRWLKNVYWQAKGDSPSDKAVSSSLDILEHKALEAAAHNVYLRVARLENKIVIDLGTPDWSALEVTADGWQIVKKPCCRFRRTANSAALPMPSSSGTLEALRPLCATTDANWLLIKGWLLDAFKGHGPYLVGVVTGEQGSAKTTLCELLRTIVDPLAKGTLGSLPREEKDLAVDGNSEYCLAYDNVSYLPQWLSDSLCRVATGAGIKSRQLYTDSEQIVLDICAPILLNGIPDFAESNDLLGRSLIISQPSIADEHRLERKELLNQFEAIRSVVFGGLLDLLSRGLGNIETIQVANLPRMADSAKWVTACLGDESFLQAYRQNINEAVDLGLEASPIAAAVRDFLADPKWGFTQEWTGTAGDLLKELNKNSMASSHRQWPTNPKALADRLRRDAPALRAVGIHVSQPPRRGRARLIVIKKGDSAGDAQVTQR